MGDPRLSRIKIFVLDMDGTIYLGESLFSFTKGFLRRVEEHLSQAVDIAKGGGISLEELTGALNILYGDE